MTARLDLTEEFFDYVRRNKMADPARLRLESHGKHFDFNVDLAITQIECRRKFSRKLSYFTDNKRFVFPSVVAGEQSTNEYVARYHTTLLEDTSELIDMTSGLGIDSMSFAKAGCRVTAIEIDEFKAACLKWNSEAMGLSDMRVVCGDSVEIIEEILKEGETVFIDPHRRDSGGGRVYGLKDCLPDVRSLLPLWRGKHSKVWLKLSPMLDIEQTVRELPGTVRISAVCFKGECKEILVYWDHDSSVNENDIELSAVDIDEHGIISDFRCTREFARVPAPVVSEPAEIEPGHYLYIPSAGMMKLGAWGAVCAKFPGLLKFSSSTPLFTSMWYYRTFPGRVLMIDSFPGSSELKKLKGERINVAVRNYPMTAEQLCRKTGIISGGENWLIGAKAGAKSRPVLMFCKPVED